MVKTNNNIPSIQSGTNELLQLYLEAIRSNQDVQIDNVSHNLREEITKRFERAIAMLYRKDRFLLEHKMNEVNVCGRLAIYLQKQFNDFKGYYVDIEYYMLSVPCDEYQGGNTGRIRIDIILHSRGYYGSKADILLALEAKYTPEGNRGRLDRNRLEKLTVLYNPNTPSNAVNSTLVGVFLRFNEHGCIMSFYSSGVEIKTKVFKPKKR